MRLVEFKIEKTIEQKIDEFGVLSNKIKEVKSVLDGLTKKYKVIEKEIRPILEELHQQNQKSIQTQNYLITLKRMGYNRDNFKYKESFEKSLEKVNKQTRKVLEEILQSTKTVTTVVSSIGVHRLTENVISDMLKKLFSSFKRFISPLRKSTKSLDGLNGILKRMV